MLDGLSQNSAQRSSSIDGHKFACAMCFANIAGPITTDSLPSAIICAASVPNATVPGFNRRLFQKPDQRRIRGSFEACIGPVRVNFALKIRIICVSSAIASSKRLSRCSEGCVGIGRHSSVKRHSPASTFFAEPP